MLCENFIRSRLIFSQNTTPTTPEFKKMIIWTFMENHTKNKIFANNKNE